MHDFVLSRQGLIPPALLRRQVRGRLVAEALATLPDNPQSLTQL